MPIVAVIPEPNRPDELREVPLPKLEMDSALLDVERSEVCGTDIYLQQGRLQGVPYPLVPGHPPDRQRQSFILTFTYA